MHLFGKCGMFVCGLLFGTAGLKALATDEAKKVYVAGTAAALRAKECTMEEVTKVQECAEDILAEAKQVNAEKAAAKKAEVIADTAE